jgi:hypothetical protein
MLKTITIFALHILSNTAYAGVRELKTTPANVITSSITAPPLYVTGGNVGIGTTAPGTKLHVSSGTLTVDGTNSGIVIGLTNASTSGTATPGVKISGVNDTGFAIINPSSVDLEVRTVGTVAQVGTFSGNRVDLMQNGSSVLTLGATTGNVGIGTTAPGTKLHVSSGTLTVDGTGAGLNVEGVANPTLKLRSSAGATNSGTIQFSGSTDSDLATISYGQVNPTGINFTIAGAQKAHVSSTGMGILTGAGGNATTLDVNGNAQFGSGVNKSTFSTTGALTMASGALITSNGAAGSNGIVINQTSNNSTTQIVATSNGGVRHFSINQQSGEDVRIDTENGSGTNPALRIVGSLN